LGQESFINDTVIRRIFRIIETTRHSRRNRLAFVLSIYGGMRVGEIAALTVGDVATPTGDVRREIKLSARQTKGSKGRTVVLSRRVRNEVGEHLSDRVPSATSRDELYVLDLHVNSEPFPIEVPLRLDARAARQKVTVLAHEIVGKNPNAIVIANGVKCPHQRVKNFMLAKGLNGLDDRDVSIIVTYLNPVQYAELNVIWGWLAIPDVITLFYEDQISQAVGRNTGFRKSQKATKTEVICSAPFDRGVLKKCFGDSSARIRLARSKAARKKN
jgi:hypothetical protein